MKCFCNYALHYKIDVNKMNMPTSICFSITKWGIFSTKNMGNFKYCCSLIAFISYFIKIKDVYVVGTDPELT